AVAYKAASPPHEQRPRALVYRRPSPEPARLLLDHHRQRGLLAAAHDLHLDRLPHREARDDRLQFPAVLDRLAPDAHYHTPRLEAALDAGRVGVSPRPLDAPDLRQVQLLGDLLVYVEDAHAEVSAADDAVLHQLLHDRPAEVAGDCQADALGAARAA